MGKVAKSVAHSVGVAVHNIIQTVEQPVVKLVTNPSKLNLGDALVLGTAGLAAPTVNAVRHPGDIPTEAAILVGGAALASATIAAAPAAGTEVITTSAGQSAGAYSSSFAGSGGGGGGVGLYGASTPLDINYVAPVYAAAPGTPASMGSNAFLSMLTRSGEAAHNLFSPILNGLGEVGKAIAAPLGTAWLMNSLNKGNSGQPGDQSVSVLPPGSDLGGNPLPGGVYGGGSGYGPYGSSNPTPGTPGANDTPTLFSSAGGTASGVTFYILLFGIAFLGYWFLFRKKKFALA